MKKLAILLFVITLGFNQVFASNDNPVKLEEQVRDKVATLLKSPQIVVEEGELTADIEFILNAEGEIVVLTVNTQEDIVKSYVKSRLNYKKVDTALSGTKSKTFKLTLRIKKPLGA